jgi:hypothetical protein
MENVMHFLRGPLLEALFGEQTSTATGPFDRGWVNGQTRQIGAARLRQVRVATNSCRVTSLRQFAPTCYPSLDDGYRRKRPLYGENLGGGMRRVYHYVDAAYTELPFFALVHSYLPGGYTVDLPARRLHASALLDQLERDRFVSIETRALFVDFSLFSPGTNTFCVVRLVFEQLATGGVQPYAHFRTARLLPYEGNWGQLQFGLDGLVLSYLVMHLVVVLWTLYWERQAALASAAREFSFSWSAYAANKWVAHDWLLQFFFWGVFGARYYIRSSMNELTALAPLDESTHYSLFNAGTASLVENNLLAVVSLLVYLKTFKYIGKLPMVSRIFKAIETSQTDMSAFLVVFMVIMLAFAVAFHVGFGVQLHEFRDVPSSMVTLLRMALGDDEFSPLLEANASLAIPLTFLFTFLVYLQLIGIAVAILLKGYARQPSEKRAALEFIRAVIAKRNEVLRESLVQMRNAHAVALTMVRRWRAASGGASAAGAMEVEKAATDGFSRASIAARRSERERRSTLFNGVADQAWPPTAGAWELPQVPIDPMSAAAEAFGVAAGAIEQRSIAETRAATNKLKTMYLGQADEQKRVLAGIDQVLLTVRALRDENFAIAHALQAKGVHLAPSIDPMSEEHTALKQEVNSRAAARAKGAKAAAIELQRNAPPPPGAASAAALLSLASRANLRQSRVSQADCISSTWTSEGIVDNGAVDPALEA